MSTTPQDRDELFDHIYDESHRVGLAHLHTLATTMTALRASMADATTADERFAYTDHLLQVSHAMRVWVAWLVPKDERPPGAACPDCGEEHEEDDDDDAHD